ncbi:CIC11C00000002136 [Sungouiella intermedia]|uniref:CIC11C00000002136 n=1 Tax=Sungouiella intermedia TaxID=45354 RepID=A0A1L0BYR2_9ASCO|nr:CIC11C00000002136 [[Candida] intermedia]
MIDDPTTFNNSLCSYHDLINLMELISYCIINNNLHWDVRLLKKFGHVIPFLGWSCFGDKNLEPQ